MPETTTNIRQQLIKSFMGVGAMRLIAIPFGLLTSIILARTLGPESFGQYAFVMALIPILSLPVSGGLSNLLVREIAGFKFVKDWASYRGIVRVANGWAVGASFAVVIGCFVLMDMTSQGSKWALLAIAIFLIPLNGLNRIRNGIIGGLGFPAYAAVPGSFFSPVFILAFYAVLAYFGLLSARTAIASQLVSAVLVLLIGFWIYAQVKPRQVSGVSATTDISGWAIALLPFTLMAVVSTVNTQIGIVLLGLMGTDEAVAAMRVAEKGAQFVALSLGLVNIVISPHIVTAYKSQNKHQLNKIAKSSARVAFAIALPIALVFFIYGRELIGTLFGNEYVDIAYWPLVCLSVGQLINVTFGPAGQLLSMSGFERDSLFGHFLALLLSVLTCVLLIPQLGAVGASIGVACGIVVWNIALAVLTYRRLRIITTVI